MMKGIERCADKATHYSVMLHELTHWADVRTEWIHCMPVREFVAEMAMHVLGLELGIPFALDRYNCIHWRVHWVKIANQDDTFFLWSTSQVDRVVFYLLEPVLHRGPNFYHDPWSVEPPVYKAHQGCLPQMDVIWECRSTEEHDVFRRVAEKVIAEITKLRPEVVKKLRVVTHDG